MASEILINPQTFKDNRDAVATAWNEGLRLWMEDHGFNPQFDFTPEQQTFFAKTAYSQDAAAMRKTIVARIATRDTSVPSPTPEQVSETLRLLDEVGKSINRMSPDAAVVKALAEDLQARAQAPAEPAAEAPTEGESVQAAQGGGNTNVVVASSVPQAAPKPPPPPEDTYEGRAPVQKLSEAPQSMKDRAYNYIKGAQPDMEKIVEKVIDALIVAEGNAADDAVGDDGRAVGKYQQWPISVEEANRIVGRKDMWSLEDRKNPALSRAMAKTILSFHYRRGVTDPVKLGAKWRNPYGDEAPDWYKEKVKKGLKPEAKK